MSTKREFTVAIYANEYKQICAWVLKHQNLETGGDLFGLWSDADSAVIQLVLGPGKNCQRATHSFYQDVAYLEEVGSNLTGKEGVCHIGEWHSHHTIGLKRPSGGDERTVWTNMPKYGLSRFLLFIANIETHASYGCEAVSVGCFLFEFVKGTNEKLEVLQGKFHLMPNESPFRSERLSVSLEKGAECLNQTEDVKSLKIIHTERNLETDKRPVMGIPVLGSQKSRKSRKHKGRAVRVDIKPNKRLKRGEEPETENENEEEADGRAKRNSTKHHTVQH